MKSYYSGLDHIIGIQRMFLGVVTHEIKVTRIKSGLWGVRCFTNGELNQEIQVHTRGDIGRAAREMLRVEDKCGNISIYAHSARERICKETTH